MNKKQHHGLKFWSIASMISILFPFLVMIVTSFVMSVVNKTLIIDFLMPVELGVLIVGGSIIMLAITHRLMYRFIEALIGVVLIIVALFVVMIAPIITGLATGTATQETFWIVFMWGAVLFYQVASLFCGLVAVNVLKYIYKNSSKI